LIQPIVLYLNTNYTELPLTFRSVIPQVQLLGVVTRVLD
jgi:hypothetical protein